jgi:hypothetical protein
MAGSYYCGLVGRALPEQEGYNIFGTILIFPESCKLPCHVRSILNFMACTECEEGTVFNSTAFEDKTYGTDTHSHINFYIHFGAHTHTHTQTHTHTHSHTYTHPPT